MNLDTELEAIHWNLVNNCNELIYVSINQVKSVAHLMEMGLEDPSRNNRIAVLRLLVGSAIAQIAGVEICSTKNLTSPVASFLIEHLLEPNSFPWRLSDYGRELLSAAESRAKEQSGAG